MMRPPSVAPLARAQYAPTLTRLYVGPDWRERLDVARAEVRRYADPAPALALPEHADPAMYHWPVVGRHVAIYGALPIPRLRRLLAALLRDGAAIAAGIDTDGALHTAADYPSEAAA